MMSWKRLHADTIGHWETSLTECQKGKMGKRKKIRNKVVTTHEMTMIDEATSWPEIETRQVTKLRDFSIGGGYVDALDHK